MMNKHCPFHEQVKLDRTIDIVRDRSIIFAIVSTTPTEQSFNGTDVIANMDSFKLVDI